MNRYQLTRAAIYTLMAILAAPPLWQIVSTMRADQTPPAKTSSSSPNQPEAEAKPEKTAPAATSVALPKPPELPGLRAVSVSPAPELAVLSALDREEVTEQQTAANFAALKEGWKSTPPGARRFAGIWQIATVDRYKTAQFDGVRIGLRPPFPLDGSRLTKPAGALGAKANEPTPEFFLLWPASADASRIMRESYAIGAPLRDADLTPLCAVPIAKDGRALYLYDLSGHPFAGLDAQAETVANLPGIDDRTTSYSAETWPRKFITVRTKVDEAKPGEYVAGFAMKVETVEPKRITGIELGPDMQPTARSVIVETVEPSTNAQPGRGLKFPDIPLQIAEASPEKLVLIDRAKRRK